MARASHAVQTSGRLRFLLKGAAGEGPEEELQTILRRLNGVERFSVVMWRVPSDAAHEEEALHFEAEEYIQCAGSADRALTCEIREAGSQYVLGREPVASRDKPDVVIPWSDYTATVKSNEALTIEEVVELFSSYYRSGREPAGFGRREILL